MNRRRSFAIGCVLTLSLILQGCGGVKGEGPGMGVVVVAPTPTPTPAPSPTPTPTPAGPNWVGSWTAGTGAVDAEAMPANGITYRNVVRMSIGGSAVRVRLSNRYGSGPVRFERVTVAKSPNNRANGITASTLQVATFGANKSESITLQVGEEVWTNAMPLNVDPFDDLAVSMYLPNQPVENYTSHALSRATSFYAPGNQATNTSLTNVSNYRSWHFATAIDVDAAPGSNAIVAVGDSITDGGGTTILNNRWTNLLSVRLAQERPNNNLAVLNEGIGSSRIRFTGGNEDGRAGVTPSVLSRWSYDATDLSGVKYIILFAGVNDIGHYDSQRPFTTAQDLINAITTLIEQANAKGIKVIGGTVTPFAQKAGYYSVTSEAIRNEVNNFIRTSPKFYKFIDFEKCVRNNATPPGWRADISDDRLHPNDKGTPVLANCVDLSFFDN